MLGRLIAGLAELGLGQFDAVRRVHGRQTLSVTEREICRASTRAGSAGSACGCKDGQIVDVHSSQTPHCSTSYPDTCFKGVRFQWTLLGC